MPGVYIGTKFDAFGKGLPQYEIGYIIYGYIIYGYIIYSKNGIFNLTEMRICFSSQKTISDFIVN